MSETKKMRPKKDCIIIRGASEHNLKDIDVDIPRNEFVVLTGLSGSGKSSLAFDTIYAEGQRRYMESLSSYARQFLGQMEKPNVEKIEGLSPAISIDQKSTNKNPRSTVGTVTEIYDYFRRGRGHGSGNGKTAGKGHKGQKARSGATRPGFEGGQMPLYRRIPKRGFTNRNTKEIIGINVSALEVFENDTVVTIELLKETGIVKNERDGIKILGNGELTKKLTVQANKFSASAVEKIEAMGGKAEVI